MNRMRVVALTGALAGLAAGSAFGQGAEGRGSVTVAPLIGYMKFDKGAALDNMKVGGLSAAYRLGGGLSLGAYLEAGRANSLGDYFPAALLRTGGVSGTTQLFFASQRVTVMSVGGSAAYSLALSGATLSIGGGLGRWTVFPDVEQQKSANTFSGLEWNIAAALGIRLGGSTAVRLDLRSVHFNGFDRSRLNVVTPAYQNTLYPDFNRYPNEPRHECAAKECSMSNLRVGLGFVYYPHVGN